MDSTVSRRAFVTGAVACAGTAYLGSAAVRQATADEQPATATSTPRYVFLFIGDGMSYPQVQATAYYRGALAAAGADAEPAIEHLSFMDFPVVGAQCTYDSSSVCPDSASTATAIASGRRTFSGVINVDTTGTETFETIAEKLKAQKGTRIGIVTSVNLNHATPAAFYAHQPSRRNYYEIGEELASSGFDYFAGGALLAPQGPDGDRQSLYDVAAEAGYTVARTYADASKLTAADLPAVVVSEVLADEDAISYELDRAEGEWALADYVARGIELLSETDQDPAADAGLFMMCEGGKIDWACHANDCAAAIHDVCALDEAVQRALDFYAAHPDETLVVVTGDHETGGLSIGYAETNYDSFLANLEAQKITYARFDSDCVARYVEEQTPFADAMAEVEELFGLKTPEAAQDGEGGLGTLVLTDYELGLLQDAYERTLAQAPRSQDQMSQEEYVHYGTYEPFSVTLTHVLNRKVGVDFATYAHSGLTVPVFALGRGAEAFEGYYDNTQIYQKLAELTGVA